MLTKDITAIQYAKYKKAQLGYCTVQNVRKHLLNNGIEHKFFNGEVWEVKYYSRFYLFVVPESMVIPD